MSRRRESKWPRPRTKKYDPDNQTPEEKAEMWKLLKQTLDSKKWLDRRSKREKMLQKPSRSGRRIVKE